MRGTNVPEIRIYVKFSTHTTYPSTYKWHKLVCHDTKRWLGQNIQECVLSHSLSCTRPTWARFVRHYLRQQLASLKTAIVNCTDWKVLPAARFSRQRCRYANSCSAFVRLEKSISCIIWVCAREWTLPCNAVRVKKPLLTYYLSTTAKTNNETIHAQHIIQRYCGHLIQ